ncbi:MAG TPA: hypothetical protein VGG15_11480 [Terriglobales bacterium]|jgi:hypothetical protein
MTYLPSASTRKMAPVTACLVLLPGASAWTQNNLPAGLALAQIVARLAVDT